MDPEIILQQIDALHDRLATLQLAPKNDLKPYSLRLKSPVRVHQGSVRSLKDIHQQHNLTPAMPRIRS